jgi:hypothetical protein
VPSGFVFVSTDGLVAFSSRKSEAPAMGFPARSRTVPDRTVAGRDRVAGVCARVDRDATNKIGSDRPKPQHRNVLAALIRKEFIAGILLTTGRLARWVGRHPGGLAWM